jgi:hypothetical protein
VIVFRGFRLKRAVRFVPGGGTESGNEVPCEYASESMATDVKCPQRSCSMKATSEQGETTHRTCRLEHRTCRLEQEGTGMFTTIRDYMCACKDKAREVSAGSAPLSSPTHRRKPHHQRSPRHPCQPLPHQLLPRESGGLSAEVTKPGHLQRSFWWAHLRLGCVVTAIGRSAAVAAI